MIWQIVDGCIELFIFFFSHAQIYRYIYKIRWDEKIGDKKRCNERRVEYDKGMENLGHETSKYCFSILFRNDDGETRWWRCFQKKYIRPCPWLSMLYFFPPRSSFFQFAFFSLRKARAADWLRNFETKTLIRSEIESTSQFPVSFFLFFLFLRQKSSEIESNRKEGKNYPFQKFIFEFHYSQRLKKKSYVRRIKYQSIN